MKKALHMLSALLLAAGILAGCGTTEQSQQNNQQAEQQTEQQATITLTEDGEEVSSKEVAFEEGANLMDVMKENFEVEEDAGMITSIEGHSQDEGASKYWLYTVNGEMAQVGAADLELSDEDEVAFNLQKPS
jgi:Tfp pilus assembly protein PilV